MKQSPTAHVKMLLGSHVYNINKTFSPLQQACSYYFIFTVMSYTLAGPMACHISNSNVQQYDLTDLTGLQSEIFEAENFRGYHSMIDFTT